MKYKLIGSAGSLETLIKGIKDKWCWDVELVCELSETKWLLVNKTTKKFIPKVHIIKKKNRYRFELQEGES